MLKKLLVMIAIIVGGHAVNAAAASFTESDWAGIPTPGEFSVEEVMELFVGPVNKSGREWTLCSFTNDKLKDVTADRDFEVRQLVDEDLFAHQQFTVDSAGVLKFDLFLVSRTKECPSQPGDGESVFNLATNLPITTQLTPEELMNPIVKAVRSSLTFEEELKLARENMGEFERTVGARNARQLLMFVRPDRVEELRAMFDEELGDERK
ncbi:hypothetical protein [Candidatus Bodocaedibacter vickermanii]|uniref:DUF4476 domain-containing protein n=1 Tax=Candidatus Bodocaedibacter vickermanii TaxID=2741701 RepID=A0A7L9RSW4_9PROT|nr:hypothetical protein CPBP_00400 [Candidatus Paracaedibacteraceae bacterium 'Lake Konstanz']